jgi:16S rRNA (cytosine1407-C5)-methyltransferase
VTPANRLENYRRLLNADQFDELQQSIARPLAPALRVNTLKIDLDQARSTWPDWYRWQIRSIPFCESGWQIFGNDRALSQTIEHRTGFYYIQDAASMLPAEMFEYESNEWPLVLDMAASPGGKTTHLVSKINDRGLVIANDSSSGRIPGLRSNLHSWGALSIALTSYPGEKFGEWFPDTFDKVLLDAPCSGESLRTAERRATRFVSDKERLALQRRQIKLLASALQVVKVGGQVVYSTCTLAPEEDEAVLDALFTQFPNRFTIESVNRLLSAPAPALAADGDQHFHSEIQRAVRLWPHLYDTSGFFAALIRKTDNIESETTSPPERSLAHSGMRPIAPQPKHQLFNQLRDNFNFDLESILSAQQLELLQRNESVYVVPESLLSQFENFPCIAVGMLIGEFGDAEFMPSHELITRFGPNFTGRRLMLSDEHVKVWLNGGDLRGLESIPYPSGSIILLEDDRHRLLGRGKVLRDRLRNLLPKR